MEQKESANSNAGEFKYLLILWIITIFALFKTLFHHGSIFTDCGREIYYAQRLLEGKILYRDLFNIYGPFSYMFNAMLFKTFGSSLNTLYFAGSACAFGLVTLIFKIARHFFSCKLSLVLGIFAVVAGISHLHVFNFVFPYSYAMLYGILSFALSLHLLLSAVKRPEAGKLLFLSSFFAGLSAVCKYEFLIYFPVILYAIFEIDRGNWKKYLISFLSFLVIPALCCGYLIFSGVRLGDFLNTAQILHDMAKSATLAYFYKGQGVYFSKFTILYLLRSFVFALFAFWLVLKGFTGKNTALKIVLPIVSLFIIARGPFLEIFMFLPVATVFLALWHREKFKSDIEFKVLFLAVFAVGLKVFFGLTLANYGIYFVCFYLILFLAMLKRIFIDSAGSADYEKCAIWFLAILSFVLFVKNFAILNSKSVPVGHSGDLIYSVAEISRPVQNLLSFIKTETKRDDKIVIFPEGQLINYLADRRSDDFYNSLIPLYVEVFGDERLIDHFSKNPPEYIIFDNWKTSDYGQNYICSDYAVAFCNYVAQNYDEVKTIEDATLSDSIRFLIFRKKY